MPKQAKGLTATFVERTREPGRYSDGKGLMLLVTATGQKRWTQRVTITAHGKSTRTDLGLGGYPVVSLSEARERALENLRTIESGGDPREKPETKVHTFAEAAEELLAMKGKELVNPKHLAQWRMTLRDYAGPVLGHLPVAGIGLDEVLRALKPHWEARPETASRLRGRIEAVLSLATVMGWREGPNPATWGGNLAMLLPARSRVKKVRHQPALAVADVPEWFERLRERKGISARALEFLTLTWARSGEVRGATWNEIDLRAGVWTIPAEKMKAGREHVVPLSPDAVSLLKSSGKIEGSDLIFPGAQGKPLSDMTLAAVMKRMHEYRVVSEDCPDGWADPSSGRPAVPHGLRSTARVWAGENGWPVDLAEHGLAHKLPDPVELAYNRSSYVSRRAPMMQAWADFLHQRPEAARQAPPHLQAV